MSSPPQRELKVVFDVAGVLLRWDTGAVYDGLFEQSGRDRDYFFSRILNAGAQNAVSAGAPMQALLEDLARRHPSWKDEIMAWSERWDEMLVGAIDGTLAVAGELKERGHALYLLGNWGVEEFERARARFAFFELFDDVLLSGQCGFLKPDPRIFALAEERFGLDPARTLFIDDRADNVQAALVRNWNGVIFTDPRQLYLVLMEYGIL